MTTILKSQVIRNIFVSLVSFTCVFAYASLALANDGLIPNPLHSDFNTVPKFIAGALKVLVMVALPIVTLFFVYSGFLFIKAQGNQSELKAAKENFLYVVLGSLLILGAWVIATLIGGTVSQLVQQ